MTTKTHTNLHHKSLVDSVQQQDVGLGLCCDSALCFSFLQEGQKQGDVLTLAQMHAVVTIQEQHPLMPVHLRTVEISVMWCHLTTDLCIWAAR